MDRNALRHYAGPMDATRAFFTVIVAALSCGCVGNEPGDRVVARVNGASITRSHVEDGLERAGHAAGANARSVLEALIDQRLLVQQALAEELDREPRVAQSIDAARSQILAQAWIAALAQTHKPNELAVHGFYADNPLLFSKRRLYRVVELHVSAPDAAVAAALGNPRDPFEAAGWLAARNVRFELGTSERYPEDLPAGVLASLATLPLRGTVVARTADGISLLQLLERRDAPVSEPDARDRITRMLAVRSLGDVAAREVERLRRTASIEYADSNEMAGASLGGPQRSARASP